MNHTTRSRLIVSLILAAGLPMAHAQDTPPASTSGGDSPAAAGASARAQPERSTAAFKGTVTDLGPYVARALQRLALLELRIKRAPSTEDQALTQGVIDIARELDPANPDLVRAEAAIAHELGDTARVAAATRRLVELEPANTVAQLAMIMSRVGQMQTIPERTAVLERFMGADGASLDTGVRSRLAFEACRLYHERGDIPDAARALKQALTLDPTNKDAAVFAYTFFTERVDDPAGRFDLLTNLLLADPGDAVTLASMAELCASVGAFAEGRRFESSAKLITAALGQRENTSDIVKTTVLDWALEGPQTVIADLNKVLSDNRQSAALTIKAMEEQLIPTSGIPKPEEITLDPLLERVRAFAALESGDDATVDSAVANIERTIDNALHDLDAVATGTLPGKISPDLAADQARKLRADLCSTLYWLQRDPERARSEMERLAGDAGVNPADPWIITSRAWKVLREGKPADAIGALRAVAADYTLADVGLATAYEQTGDTASAVSRWRAIAKDIPLSPDAGWARSRLRALSQSPEPDPESAAKIRRAAALVPKWTDEMAANPTRFLSLRAEIVNPDAGRLDRLRVRVIIRNEAPVPLGIGAGRTIDPTVVVDAKAEAHINQLFGALGTEFIDLSRRFSLAPMQQLEIEDWCEPGFVGWMIESSAHRTVRERWRVLYGFVTNENGVPVPGPMGLTSETRSVIRPALPEALLDVAALAQRVRVAPENELAAALVAVRSRLLDRDDPAPAPPNPAAFRGVDPPKPPVRPVSTALSPDDRALLASACVARYPECSREARLLMVASLPHELQCAEMKDFDALIRQEKDPGVAAIVIVTRVRDAGDPMLEWALAQSDPRLLAIANARAGAIAARARTFASAGPGLYGLITGVVSDKPADQLPGQPPTQPAGTPAGNK